MTTDDHQNETNQAIFDDYVRRTLKGTGVEYIEEGPERILQIVENGDISMEMAVNAIAIAQAAFLMTAVYTPYEEPEWLKGVWALRRRFGEIAESVLKCLGDFLDKTHDQLKSLDTRNGDPETYSLMRNLGTALVHLDLIAASPKWQWESSELPDRPRQIWAENSLIVQDIEFALRRAEFFRSEGTGEIYEYRGQTRNADYYEPDFTADYVEDTSNSAIEWQLSTKWHRRYVASVIGRHIDDSEWLPLMDFRWGALLEACLWLIRELPSALSQTGPPSEEGLDGDLKNRLGLTPDDSEYWAWEFGRLVATWPDRVEPLDDVQPPSSFFGGYESYMAAFSILAPDDSSVMPGVPDPAVIGAMVTWDREHEDSQAHFRTVDFAPGVVDHLAHWIARLGYRYARKHKSEDAPAPTLAPVANPSSKVVSPDSNIETPGSDDLIWRNARQMAHEFEQILRQTRASMAKETEQLLRQELTEPIWIELSDDAKAYLFQAEEALKEEQEFPKQAALNYARAVECALEDWLPPPHGERNWPSAQIGEWCDVLRKMSKPQKERRHRLDPVIRSHFDAKHATPLVESLDVLRKLRVRDAHRDNRPSRPLQTRKVVLGDENTASIFELILRFAKRIRE